MGSNSIVGERAPLFWTGCAAISAGVALHLPMLAMAHDMSNHLSGIAADPWMWLGMALIGIGVPLAIFGALPKHRTRHDSHQRGRATGLVAGSSKVGGVAVQAFALVGLIPTMGSAAAALMLPMGESAALVGRETRGRSLRELEAGTA